jgi:hypothetical protein
MDLYGGVFMPHLLVTALERNLDRPCMYLGEEVARAAVIGVPDKKALRAGYWRGAERQAN